jgi:ferrochelatase
MSEHRDRIGVLALNVGTPDAPRAPEVRRYLRQFLGDPRVLDMNPIGRAALLNLVILPFRPKESAHAYRSIWEPDGSPLLRHSNEFAAALETELGSRFLVRPAMRYGNPSIACALAEFRASAIDRIVAFPLYPQYASSTTGTSLEEVYRRSGLDWNVPSISVVPPFWNEPELGAAFARVGREVLDDLDPDHVLLSFHGVPERHVRKSDDTGSHCLASQDCCARIVEANRNCYRAQCHRSAEAIAAALDLPRERWTLAFQSRLGKTPWIRPYTDETVVALAERGVRRLAVFCPAFVADCLETLEEIGMRAREDFVAHGGEDLRLVPSLNSSPSWIELAARLVRRAAWPDDVV